MWEAKIFTNSQNLRPLQLISQSKYYTIMFCDNGITFADVSSVFFIAKSDMFLYRTLSFTQFIVTGIHDERRLPIDDRGVYLKISRVSTRFMLELYTMYSDNLIISFEVDHGLASTGGRLDISPDRLYRVMAYREKQLSENSPILECPFQLQDFPILDEDREIKILVDRGCICTYVKNRPVGMASCQFPNYMCTIQLQEKRLKQLKHNWGSTMFIIGYVPELGELPACYYLRLPGYGSYTILLP